MAKSSFSPLIAIRQSAQLNNIPVFGFVKLRKGQYPLSRRLTAQIRSSSRDQVFEDHSNGIICYRDSKGEIICEGLDEGPCLRQQFPLPPYLRRDAEIVEILQKKWLEIVEGGGRSGDSPITVLKDSNYNGFNNTLYAEGTQVNVGTGRLY
ncbi:hypothetical protein V2J09_022538 [Rumex salicifolius]